jgi:hypothetical protein
MTTTLDSFVSTTQLSTSAQTLVSTSGSEKKFLGKVTFTNTSSSNVEVTVWRLPSATSETSGSGGNWSVKQTIPAGKTWICKEVMTQALGNTMKLSALADTASVVNADLSGTVEL